MKNRKPSSNLKAECIRLNSHVWASTAGGYHCGRCHLFITDEDIRLLRWDGINEPLEVLLKMASEKAERWIDSLHFWTENNPEI